MSHHTKIFLSLALLVLLGSSVFAPRAFAQSANCEQTYFVEKGDWLSIIAQRYLGEIKAFPALAEATNAAAKVDPSFTAIPDPNKIEVGQKICIPAVTAVPGRELAGIYTSVGPAADASALIETLVLGGDGQVRYVSNYVGKAEFDAKGTWTQDGTTVTVKLYEQAGKPVNDTLTFTVQDGNLVQTSPATNQTFAKTSPGVAFYSGLYTSGRKSFDGSETLVALTLLPNGEAQMNLTKADGTFVMQTGTWTLGTNPDTGAPSITVNLTQQGDQTISETYVFQIQGENLRGTEYNSDKWGTDLTFTKYHAPVEPSTPANP